MLQLEGRQGIDGLLVALVVLQLLGLDLLIEATLKV